MEFVHSHIEGLVEIIPRIFEDERGIFFESYHKPLFTANGVDHDFVQSNQSFSKKGVLRGLHFQHTPPQGKLVGVVHGAIWDVVVDIRPWSQTYGHYYAEELSGENGVMLFVPPGFAHVFCVLGDEPADVLYQTTEYYAPDGEGGIRYNDAVLDIPWPISSPIVSARDSALPSWRDYCANQPQWGEE